MFGEARCLRTRGGVFEIGSRFSWLIRLSSRRILEEEKKKERETVKPRVAFEVELAGFARDKEGSEGRRGRIDNVPGLLPFRPGGG